MNFSNNTKIKIMEPTLSNLSSTKPEEMTDFEKLCIANAYIKQLRREKGELLADIDELEYKLKEALNLIKELNKLSIEERVEIKKDKFYEELKEQLKNLEKKNKQLNRSVEELIIKNLKK